MTDDPNSAAPKLTRDQRRLRLLQAVVDAGGNTSAAAHVVGCTPANVGMLLARLGLGRGRDRRARVAAIEQYLVDQAFQTATSRKPVAAPPERRVDEAAFARTVASRPAASEMPTVAARCHPDRQEFQMGLCRECYRERRERSMSTPVGVRPIDPKIAAELEAKPDPKAPRLHPIAPGGAPPVGRLGQPPTASQFRVLELIATGATYEEVAKQLDLSPRTVSSQVSDAAARVGARHVVEVFAKLGWLRPNYEETTAQELRMLLERVDAAIHRAIHDAERTA